MKIILAITGFFIFLALFRRWIYKVNVYAQVERLFVRHFGQDRGLRATKGFTALKNDLIRHGKLNISELMSQFRTKRVDHTTAAITLLGVVVEILERDRKTLSEVDGGEAVEVIISFLNEALAAELGLCLSEGERMQREQPEEFEAECRRIADTHPMIKRWENETSQKFDFSPEPEPNLAPTYGQKVIDEASELLARCEEPGAIMAGAMLHAQFSKGDFDKIFPIYEQQKLTPKDGAIALIDGLTGDMRGMIEAGSNDPTALSMVEACESVLDSHARNGLGKVIPRNGKFGRSMTKHMGEFMTEPKPDSGRPSLKSRKVYK